MDKRGMDQIIRDEGSRAKPYRCTEGKLTIGIGRNLDDVGLSQDEIRYLFQNDYDRARDTATLLPCWTVCNSPRQAVLVNMVFQLGMRGLMKFKRMMAALDVKDFDRAADEMLDSKWNQQTPKRAQRLALQMRTGKWID
jgi:lysozyme